MPPNRIPWWLYLVAASFTVCFFVGFVYLPVALPQGPGFLPGFGPSAKVLNVVPGSQAESQGVRAGDRIVSLAGHTVHNANEFQVIEANLAADQRVPMRLRRNGQEFDVELVLPASPKNLSASLQREGTGITPLARAIFVVVSLFELVLGLFILFKRPNNIMAVSAGIFLCLVAAQSDLYLAPGSAVVFRGLPRLIQWLALPSIVVSIPWTVAALFFSLTFPCLAFRKKWAWYALGATALAIFGSAGFGMTAIYYDLPLALNRATGWAAGIGAAGAALSLVAALVVLILNVFRVRAANERRRVRLVLLGLIIWVGWFAVLIVASFTVRAQVMVTSGVFSFLAAIASVPFPICVAYAVLKERLFDVSVVVRQGVQYAVARGALLIPVPIVVVILVFDVLRHKDQPLGALLSAHGWAYALAGVVAVVAHKKQERWLVALDRRFYRERYNAQQLLRETVDEIRVAATLSEVAPKVVARIAQALHPEFVAVLTREAREPGYRCAASEPAGSYPRNLSAESKLMSAFRLFGKPLQISLAESGWLKQQLPSEDTDFLRQSRIDLMVPIASSPEGREALLVLGTKKSEEPYSEDDRELLSSIGSALALLLERPVAAARSAGLEECPQCGLCYESGMGRCANEGAKLTFTPIPRLLTARYRLERRLGRGGMGTVYKANDTALERAVAVKVIREDLVASADAAERFRREAKAAAAFSHPNLVTVHDFGVDAETRVFLVMEFLEGLTLRQQLQQNKKLTPEQTLIILGGVCAGLETAHGHGMVHRDLKPENVFLARTEGGEVPKILDFGLAKFLVPPVNTAIATMDTASGVLVGTPQYMSPEQLKGEAATPAWDLWALAVITYEMLTGEHPFASASVAQLQSSVLSGKFGSISAAAPEAPPQWQEFFEREFNPETGLRSRSPREFKASLEKTLKKSAGVSG